MLEGMWLTFLALLLGLLIVLLAMLAYIIIRSSIQTIRTDLRKRARKTGTK